MKFIYTGSEHYEKELAQFFALTLLSVSSWSSKDMAQPTYRWRHWRPQFGEIVRAFQTGSPREEAQRLFEMLRTGAEPRNIRKLIEIPPDDEHQLLAYVKANLEESFGILRVLAFRERVLEEFERLVRFRNPASPCPREERYPVGMRSRAIG